MEGMKRAWNRITTALVILVVIGALLIVGVRLVGIHPYTVISGSMEPEYPVGALIYVKPAEAEDLKKGDVITFMMDEDMVATHRIVDVIPDETDSSVIRFQTKGDANNTPDANLVHCNNVIGKPVFTIPYLGYIADFVRRPPGLYVAIGVIALLVLLEFLPDMLFPEEKNESEKKEEKKFKEE